MYNLPSELLGAIVFFVLTFLLELVPPLRKAWAKVETEWKASVLLGIAILVVVAITALTCAGVDTGTGLVCPERGMLGQFLFSAFIGVIAWTASQMSFPSMQSRVGSRIKWAEEMKELDPPTYDPAGYADVGPPGNA